MKYSALALLGLLAVSVFVTTMQQAFALDPITFTTKTTFSTSNTLPQQLYENGTNSVIVLDATNGGTYEKDEYKTATGTVTSATTTLTGSGNTINSAAYLGPVDLSRYSLQFNGSTQYATAAANTVFDIASEDFTIFGVFYRSSDSGSAENILRKSSGGGAGYFITVSATDRLEAYISDGVDLVNAVITDPVSTGTWYAFGAAYDRDSDLTLWLYNLDAQSLSDPNAASIVAVGSATNTQTFTLGRASAGGFSYFPGYVDYLKFISGTAITQTQFLQLVANPSAITGTSAFDFNEGLGTTAEDIISTNDLTLQGSPSYTSAVAPTTSNRISSYITGRDTTTGNNGYAKINLSDLSEVADGYQTSSYYPRNIAQSTANLYSPLYDNTANGNMRLGIQTRALATYSEPSIYTGTSGNPAHGVIASQDTGTASIISLCGAGCGGTAIAEHFTATAAILGLKIDKVTLSLSKTGAPTGTATVGTIDSSGNIVTTLGTIDVSTLTGSQASYTFLATGPYIVQSGDRIGIKFTGGSAGNSITAYSRSTDVYDGTNAVYSLYNAGWTDDATSDMRFILANTANVKIAVYDGSPDTEYVFFESGASNICIVKYTSSASTISCTPSHAVGRDYSIQQMSGKILLQTSTATYTLNTSTDTLTTDSNTYLTRPPQTFSISPSARTYISAAYVANTETATLWNPSAGTSATDYVMIDTASAPTLTAYDPVKYYYLQTNDLTVEATSVTATSWTIKDPGTQESISVTPYTETLGVALIQNNTIFDENVIVVNCDNGNYDVTIPYFAVGSDADCLEWWTYDTAGAAAARHLPYETTPEPVHANDYTYYTFTLSVADPTAYMLETMYGSKVVDNGDFDSSGQLQQRLLYQQCYTIRVEEILSGNSVQTGNVCAGDDLTKTISLSGIVIPPDWLGKTWSHSITRNFTNPSPSNNGLLFSVQKSETPYNASIHVVNHPDSSLATYDQWFNFTNAMGISIANVTGLGSNSTAWFTVYENGVVVINAVSSGMGFDFGDELDGFGLLFGVPIAVIFPILTAALFPKSQSHIGIIVTGAVIGIMQFFGFFSSIPFNEALWAVAFGLIAIGVMLGPRR